MSVRVGAWLLVASLALATGGCALFSMRTAYTVPEGSTLALEQPIELPPGPFRVWLQDGEYGLGAVDDYRAFCELRGENRSDTGVWLQPTRFEVVDVHYRYGMAMAPGAVHVVSLAAFERRGDELTMLRTLMTLRAETPSPLRSMVCMKRGFVGRDRFVSVAAIRAALGAYFRLTLPPR